jgi:HK97 family phage portal protein
VVLEKLIGFAERVGGVLPGVTRANRVSPALSSPWERELGVGQSWMPLSYGEYYPRSALVYSAIKIRQDAVARVPLQVYRGKARGPVPGVRGVPTGPDVQVVGGSHPVQRLLDSPNPFWTRGDLWRATETYLGLWGSAFWALERDETGRVVEVWPLRSDRMRVVPDSQRYVKGFVYAGQGQQMVSYVPEDIVWLRYFNPLDEFSELSPMAPLRLSADMAMDALRASRNGLSNDSSPGLFIETSDTPTDDEVKEFYERWESRYRGVDKVRRPALLSNGMKASNLGFSPRDMEYVRSLRWGLEDVSRVYGVPKPMLADVERITFSNLSTSRKIFWEDTIVPQLMFYEEALNRRLLPQVEDAELFVEFDTGAIEALRESENDKASRRQGYVRTGIMTVNEVRREMNLPPVDWGDGSGG